MAIRKSLFILSVVLAIIIGLYPLLSLLFNIPIGLLNIKNPVLLSSALWNLSFYTHISMGGIALLLGWVGFLKNLRIRKIGIHRTIGKIYVISALASALGGIYIGFYANGGWPAAIGFVSMGIIWLYTTAQAYLHIRAKDIAAHERMMIYSYALCFAGVTFRLWLPTLIFSTGDFAIAYPIAAWICWVPNLVVAYFITTKTAAALQ